MEVKSSTGNKAEYYWCWNANPDPIDESIDPDWRGYDQATSKSIEESYQKGIYFLEIGIGAHVYCVDIEQRYQFLKKEPFRCRQITRVPMKEYVRFIKVKESPSYTGNKNQKNDDKDKYQVKLKICELFGYPEDNEGFIFDANNELFSTEVIISKKLHKTMKNEFYNKVTFNDYEEVQNHLTQEMLREQERFIALYSGNKKVNTLDQVKIPNFIKKAEDYLIRLQEKPNLSIPEKLVFIYTLDGFVSYSLESVLTNFLTFGSQLHLYYTLLQASIAVLSKKFNYKYASNSIKYILGEEYYVFYRANQMREKFVAEEIDKIKKTGCSNCIYDEFLFSSYDKQVALDLVSMLDIKEGFVPVIFSMRIRKSLAEKNPSLFCFVEEISSRPERKEVLLSSSMIFRTNKIERHESGSHHEYTLEFLPEIYY